MLTRRDWFEITTSLLGGAGIGAAVMYLLDPQTGQQRRQFIAHKAGDVWESAAEGARSAAESVRHTGHNISESWTGLASRARRLSDDILHYSRRSAPSEAEQSYAIPQRAAAISMARSLFPTSFRRQLEPSGTGTALTVCAALALGAGLMYIFDPQ